MVQPAGGGPLRRASNWLFRSRVTGRVTIAQWPNAPLWLFLAASAAARLAAPEGRAGQVLRLAATGSLLVWAADELLRGVNPWRRILGAGVLVYGLAVLMWA